MSRFFRYLDERFHVTRDGSSLQTEFFSGVTAYFTMVYILFLVFNTIMASFPEAFDDAGNLAQDVILSNGVSANDMLIALTMMACITAAIGTLILSCYANLPFAQGPSLAISTFVSYTLCIRMDYTYNEALAAVFLSGIIFFVLIQLGVERKIQDAIPTNIKFAVTVGIGIFIAFMGLQKAHVVEANGKNLVQMVSIAEGGSYAASAILCLIGIVIIGIMMVKHIHGAILWGKLICIVLAIPLGLMHLSDFTFEFGALRAVKEALYLDFAGLFTPHGPWGTGGVLISVATIISTLCIMDVFETMGTIIATDYIITVSKEGNINERFTRVLRADAISTTIGALLGVTSVSTYVESTAMALEGGRTGLSGVVTAILFFLTILIAPFASAIPSAATATTLIMSGVLMVNAIKYINFDDIDQAIPAFLTMFMMPLSYSLVTGIAVGLITHTLIAVFTGRVKYLKKGTVILALIFCLQFFLIQ